MKVKLTYCHDGSVPTKKGLYFCIYVDPGGEPSFGLARAEYSIEKRCYVWNPELATAFGDIPPSAYMEVEGNAGPLVSILEELKQVYLILEE